MKDMAQLTVNSNTKVYVACPPNAATGGPELLHQIVHELRKLGVDARMLYYGYKQGEPVIHPAYVKYETPYDFAAEDNHENILIVPEVNTVILRDYRHIQKVIWWLSVDNYYVVTPPQRRVEKIRDVIRIRLGLKRDERPYRFEQKPRVKHLVQSEYARQHLLSMGVEDIAFLGDYLNPHFLEQQRENANQKKKDVVIYNPLKGIEVTNKIKAAAQDIEFIPIQNMTREQVADLLATAKVYIDFGNHPGKDRIPREAAFSGCCVITNKRGSAKYHADVPIPEEFKFEDEEDVEKVVTKIRECFRDYQAQSEKFAQYREIIGAERSRFMADLKSIFACVSLREAAVS